MYNVRIYKYVSGMQVRIYKDIVGDDSDNVFADDYGLEINPFNVFGEQLELMKKAKFRVQRDDVDIEECQRVSLSRTKNKIYYIARSNVWDWFVTLTIDGNKKERYDYKKTSAWVRKWFDNLKQRKCPSLYYLIVPEEHEKGGWHFHALLGGCDGLSFVESGHFTKQREIIYNFENWKYGFSTATRVKDSSRVSSYISKYITKSLVGMTKGLKRYWASQNCHEADIEDYLLDPEQLAKLKEECFEKMAWKKSAKGYFQEVDYFEIPYT